MAMAQPEMPVEVQEGLHTPGADGLLAVTRFQCEGVLMSAGALQGWGGWWLEQKVVVTGV